VGSHFGLAIFWAKVVKERVGRGRAADFVAFDCASQEKAAHGHVVYAVQEVSKTASKGAQNGSYCPGNERCEVKSLPVRCRFQFSPPNQASRLSRRFATIRSPRPRPSLHSVLYFILSPLSALPRGDILPGDMAPKLCGGLAPKL
jgi:hypothetical protein